MSNFYLESLKSDASFKEQMKFEAKQMADKMVKEIVEEKINEKVNEIVEEKISEKVKEATMNTLDVVAINLLRNKVDIDTISASTGLSKDKIKEIEKKL